MEVNEEKLLMGTELIKQCLLPELNREIGERSLEREDFNVFLYGLTENLRLIFDIIAKNKQLLFEPSTETEEFCSYLVLLLNEQCGDNGAPFQTNEKRLIEHMRSTENQYFIKILKRKDIFEKCLCYYKSKLTIEKWKRNIGAVYGYLRFTEICYEVNSLNLSCNDELFMLSVAMNLVDYFEHIYKGLGIKLFLTLLTKGDENIINKINLRAVIYDKLMSPLIIIVKDENLVLLLECLTRCIEADSCNSQSSNWCKTDDILTEIFKKLLVESNTCVKSILFLFISKLVSFEMNTNEILQSCTLQQWETFIKSFNDNEGEKWQKLRSISSKSQNSNLSIYRWVKKLLQVFSTQTFLGNSTEVSLQLKALHICYLCCVYNIPLVFMKEKWLEFIDGFSFILINLLESAKDNQCIRQDIQNIIVTFITQIKTQLDIFKDKDFAEVCSKLMDLKDKIK